MEDYKINDVVYTSGGYDRTEVEFFKVIERTEKTLTIQPIGSKVVDGDPLRVYYVIPDETNVRERHYTPKGSYLVVTDSKPFKVYINKNGYAKYEGMHIYVWNNKPIWANTGYAF